MYHSHLLINVGDNPDRPDWDRNRRWLRNLYRVHQRLAMAFPSAVPTAALEREQAYCAAYGPGGFPEQRDLPTDLDDDCDVHQPRNDQAGFLFRIDYPPDFTRGGRRPVIIVQSAKWPDWDCAFGLTLHARDDRGRPIGNTGFLLAALPQIRHVEYRLVDGNLNLCAWNADDPAVNPIDRRPDQRLTLKPGDLVRFRLRANPTRKVKDDQGNAKRKRVKPELDAHREWLIGKLKSSVEGQIQIHNFVPGWANGWRSKHEPQPKQRMQWWSVLFEGSFCVRDVVGLHELLISGIGSGKAFGFGLLSVAPAT